MPDRDLAKKEQIPTEFNEEETMRTVRKQNEIPGESRDRTVNDFEKASVVGQLLKDLEFPSDKAKILDFVRRQNKPESNEVLPVLQMMEEKQYENVFDVTKAAKLVQ